MQNMEVGDLILEGVGKEVRVWRVVEGGGCEHVARTFEGELEVRRRTKRYPAEKLTPTRSRNPKNAQTTVDILRPVFRDFERVHVCDSAHGPSGRFWPALLGSPWWTIDA